ncbi:hypothetical protein TKK_0009192 [Trichogramma kaykai]
MVLRCYVTGCKANSQNGKFSFFGIPKEKPKNNRNSEELRELSRKRQCAWIRALKQAPFTDKKLNYFKVCSNHFISGKPADILDINSPDWAPCQNLGYTVGHTLKKKETLDLHNRAIERAKKKEVNLLESANGKVECTSEEFNDNNSIGLICEDEIEDIENQFNKSLDKSTQTLENNFNVDYVKELELKLKNSEKIIEQLNFQIKAKEFSKDSFMGNDSRTLYYTGLPNTETLFIIHETVHSYLEPIKNKCALSTFQQLILTLIKLRLNSPFTDLAERFNISLPTASRTFRKTINILFICFSKLIVWPEREILNLQQFKSFKRITVIIDCFEIFIEGSEDLLANAESWSQYKHHKTIKVLIGITALGGISFISKAWGGRTSDKHIVENSGFLKHLLPGDVVLADRGFLVQESLDSIGVSLNIPAFTKGVNQLHPMDLQKTRTIANVRIHVERVIGVLKQRYQILFGILPLDMLYPNSQGESLIDKVIVVCSALFNLSPSIITEQ